MSPRLIESLSEIADAYDAFLVDQFGVLRDGRGAYPGAADALKALKQSGKQIIILSNSGKRAAENDVRLAKLGFDRANWDIFLTSGEVAFEMMKTGRAGPPGAKRILLISRDGDRSAIDGLGFETVASAGEADIILISASEGDRFPLSHYRELLAAGAARKVPCLCTNPDMVMLTASGTAYGAGAIAGLYEQMGGAVNYIGKPHPDMYDTAQRMLTGIDPSRMLCIGDSVEHDIAGASAAGLASVLVTTGILEHMTPMERDALFDEHSAEPDFILPKFLWEKG